MKAVALAPDQAVPAHPVPAPRHALPLPPHLFRLHPGGDREVRLLPGRFSGGPQALALPSFSRGRDRPRTLRVRQNGKTTHPGHRPVVPGPDGLSVLFRQAEQASRESRRPDRRGACGVRPRDRRRRSRNSRRPPRPRLSPPQPRRPRPRTFRPWPAAAETDVVVDTSLYRAVWSNKGGVLKSWKLKKHKNSNKEDLELVPALAGEIGRYPFSLGLDDPPWPGSSTRRSSRRPAPGSISPTGRRASSASSIADGTSVRAEKTFRFTGGSYALTTEIRVWKDGQPVSPSVLWGPGISNLTPVEAKQSFSASRGSAVYTRRQGLPDEREEIQARREHLQFRRLGRLRRELLRRPLRPAAAEGTGRVPPGSRGRSPEGRSRPTSST